VRPWYHSTDPPCAQLLLSEPILKRCWIEWCCCCRIAEVVKMPSVDRRHSRCSGVEWVVYVLASSSYSGIALYMCCLECSLLHAGGWQERKANRHDLLTFPPLHSGCEDTVIKLQSSQMSIASIMYAFVTEIGRCTEAVLRMNLQDSSCWAAHNKPIKQASHLWPSNPPLASIGILRKHPAN
jgi:hypothetical protein